MVSLHAVSSSVSSRDSARRRRACLSRRTGSDLNMDGERVWCSTLSLPSSTGSYRKSWRSVTPTQTFRYAVQFYSGDGIARWRLLFVLCGCLSLLMSALNFVFLPSNSTTAWWLVSLGKHRRRPLIHHADSAPTLHCHTTGGFESNGYRESSDKDIPSERGVPRSEDVSHLPHREYNECC